MTFEQAWREAYGTPEAWELERHGTAEQAQSEVYGTPQPWRRRRRARASAANIFERKLVDTLEAERLKRKRRP